MRSSFVLAALCSSVFSFGQDLVLYGDIREHEEKRAIPDATMAIVSNGIHQFNMKSDSVGHYSIALDVGKVWRVRYSAPGRVSKLVEFDLRDTPKYDGGYGMNVDIRLFREDPSMDFTFLEEPIGISRYDSVSTTIKWDMDYTAPRMERLRTLMPERYTIETDTDSVPKAVQEE